MERKKIESLDFVRALSVLFIIIFHYAAVILYDKKMDVNISRYIFPFFGGLGVSFFIIISGGGIYNSIKSNFNLSDFYKRRFLSIFPSYYIAYFITAVVLFVFSGRVIFQGDFLKIFWTLLGLDGFLSQRVQTFYLIGEWFVGFIILMYVIFPGILALYRRSKAVTYIVAVGLAITSIHYNVFLYEHIPFWNKRDIWNPIARLPEFILGMVLFEAIANKNHQLLKYITIVAVAVVLGYSIHDHRDMVINESRNIPLFSSILVILVVVYEYALKFIHSNHIISFLSKYSFLAFLYHHQILSIISSKINFQNLDKTSLIYCGAMGISLSFLLAYATFDISSKFKDFLSKKIYR